jgi:RHS repeat-associated protein
MRRRVAVVTALAVGLSLGVPPEVIPEGGGWPLSGLLSVLRQAPALAAVTGLPVQEDGGGAAGRAHYVSSEETRADGGAGRAPDRGKGIADPAPPARPATKPFTTPNRPGDETSFDERTSRRLAARSSETYDEFQNEDGSITRQIHEERINYRAADGTYQPIDTTLTKRGDRLEAGPNEIDVTLRAGGVPSASPSASRATAVAPLTPLASVTTESGETFAYDLAGAADVTAVVDGSTATYPKILPGTDLEVQATASGLKETIVLDSPAAGNEWVFPLKLDGLTPRERADGSVELVTAAGAVALRVPPGYMEDSKVDPRSGAPAQSAGVDYELVTVDGGPALKVTADQAWLSDPARQYPVRVDPSVEDARTYATTDAFVDNDTATVTHAGGNNLPVGTYDGGTTKARSFIRFDDLDADKLIGVQVRAAELFAFHTWSSDCTSHLPVYVHRISEAWTTTAIQNAGGTLASGPSYTTPIATWTIADNHPACENTGGDRSKGNWRSVSLPIRTFNGWTTGTMSNFGLALTASETNSAGWKRFTSRDFDSANYAPYLSLTYDYNVDPQVNEQYPAYGATAATLTPELMADANDPDNWPKTMTYDFILYGKDATTVITRSGAIMKKSWTVPAGKMVWGENYYWTVQVSDGSADNAKYLVKHLLSTPVPQPPVTSGLSQNGGQGFDPVIGNYTTTVRDAMVDTVGPPLEVVRSYNSIDPRTDQAFGAGWSSLLDAKVVVKNAVVGGTTAVNTVVVTYPTGREMAFGRNADGTFNSPAGRASTFSALSAGGYKLTEKDGTSYEFGQKIAGDRYAISAVRDLAGRAQTFTYTDNLVSKITTASGRTLRFIWTDTTPKRVTKVATDPVVAGDWNTANTWWYDYSGGALTKVCPPTNYSACHTYEYGASASAYQTAVANVRPYSYWRLAEADGTEAKSAVLENGGVDVGTYGGVTLGQAGPLAGSSATAAGFNGSSSQVQLPAKLASDAGNQAISMWFKTSVGAGDGVLYGQSTEATSSTAGSTYRPYNPTLYVGSDGKLMGTFPKSPQPSTWIGPLQSTGNGQCLAVPGNVSTVGTQLALAACTGGDYQKFAWSSGRQLYVVVGGVTRCLDTAEQGVTNGTDLIISACDTSQGNQKWDVQVDGQIVNDNSGLCVTSDGYASGAAMFVWACNKTRPVTQTFPSRIRYPMSSAASVADGNWHHVVLSASGNRQEMYVDGALAASETGVTVQDLGPNSSYLGRGFLGGGWPDQSHTNSVSNQGWRDHFTGSIGEVAYFDTAVDKPVVDTLWAARGAVQPMTRVVRPSGGATATIAYDGGTGRVAQVTDGNGGTWTPDTPRLNGTTKVYESAVLGGAPTNYWRMAETGVTEAKNEVKGGIATYNSVGLGSVAGPFGAEAGKAATFDGETSYVDLPPGVAPTGASSVSMWFNTTGTGDVLLGRAPGIAGLTMLGTPTMWIENDGKLRALSPSATPTGPLVAGQIAGKCADVQGNETDDGTPIQIYTCNGTSAQNWTVYADGTVRAKTKCLDVNGAGTADGTKIQLWTCNGGVAQQWETRSGRLYNPNSGKCLDDPGASTTDGTDLKLWTCNLGAAQDWRLSLVSKAAVNDGKWHHAVLATDGTSQTLYVDGAKAQSTFGTVPMASVGAMEHVLGRHRSLGTVLAEAPGYFKGSLAEVAFYASEIDANQASYQFKARDAVKSAPSGQIDYTVTGPGQFKTTTVSDLTYGRKVADIDALGRATRYGYSGKGNLRTVTDANNNMTINEYDVRGNVVTVTTCQDRSANLCSTSYASYYPDATTANPAANVLNDRLMEQRAPGSSSATDDTYLTRYTYDALGNRTSETDELGRRTTISYTDGTTAGPAGGGYGTAVAPAGLPWKVVKPDGGVQRILYQTNGDIAEQTDPAGEVTRYEYDGLGRTTLIDGGAGATQAFTHDRLDRVVTVTDTAVTNAVSSAVHTPVTTLAYNVDGLLTSETVSDSTGGDASRKVGYGYDAYGRRTSETDALGNRTEFGYDDSGRVIRQTHADGSSVLTTYDGAGNELTTEVDGLVVRSLAYDPAGRLSSETDAAGWVNAYEYTDNNLLRSVTRKSETESYVLESNTYDPAGNQITQVTNNGLTKTTRTYDAAGRNLTATVEVTDDGGTTKRTTSYGYSPDDDVVSTRLSDGSGRLAESEAMYDRLGRLRQQTTYLSDRLTPTARWKLDQNTADSAGNDPGTVSGAVTWSAERGGAASFGGSAAASIVGRPVVDTTRAYTLSAWAKLAVKDANRTVAALAGDIDSSALKVFYDKENDAWQLAMAVRRQDGTTTWLPGTYTKNSAALDWQHLAVVVTPATTPGGTSTAQLYVGGVVKGSISTTEQFDNRATDLRIGAQSSDTSSLFAGLIDDVQAYQKALTGTEVGELLTGTAPAADAQVSRTTYDLSTDGSPTSATGPNGATTYFGNDEVGRATQTTTQAVSTVEGTEAPKMAVSNTLIGYNTFGEVTEEQDAHGKISVNRYDAVGRLVEQESPAYTAPDTKTPVKAKRTITYNSVGQVESSTDPLGAETRYEYDKFGRTVKVIAPDNGVTRYSYDSIGNLLAHTDPNGATATSTFDYLGRTLSTTQAVRQDAAGYTTTYAYEDGSPWPTTVTSAAKVVTKARYNSVGEPIKAGDALGNTTTTAYDGAGRPVRTTAPDGTYTTATYDYAGRAAGSADYSAGGVRLRTRSQAYDVSGNPVSVTDARGTTKTFTYDALGQLVSQREPISSSGTDADAIVTAFGYDEAGRQTRFTDGRGNDFVTTYNSWGLPEKQIEPGSDGTFTMTYDLAGRLTRLDSPGGVSVASTYDVMGRLTGSSGTGAQATTKDKTYTYDPVGRMTSFTGSAGTNIIGYDDRGLVTSVSGVSGASSYAYNADGAMTSRTDGAGTTSYSYDQLGRPSKVENASAGVSMTYGYDTTSQVTSINYGGNVRKLGYNSLHQLTSDDLQSSAGTTISKIAYEWNLNDSLTKKTTTGFNGASTNTYSYDLADRLTSWDNGATPTVYAYDKSGNRVQAGTKTFTYDKRNQLTSDSSGVTYKYTPRGTLLSTTAGGQTITTVTDAFNQVLSQGSSVYSYDGLGRAIQKGFSYTGLGNGIAADGATVYVRDVAGGLVAVGSGSVERYAWTDAHADVVGEFTATGAALTGSVSYDPWGKVLAAGGMTGRLGYQQEWTDQATGKVDMWARWYDPATGTFDTRDTATNSPTPASGAANRFAYAEGDPMSHTDSTGNAVDGKCGEYDYACEVKKYQAAMESYTDAMDQRDREMKATGSEIAAQEAEYQRAERESQTPLLDILLQVGIGMLLDMIGYNSLVGCLGGSIWDCVDLAMSALGPIKALKIGKSLYRAADRAFSGYRLWKRIVDGASTLMRRSQDLINMARKHLNDVMKKLPKKPKPPKRKKKPPVKKKPRPKPRPERKPKPSAQARPDKPKVKPAEQDRPDKAKPKAAKEKNETQPTKRKQQSDPGDTDEVQRPEPKQGCPATHSFDPSTRVLMADGTTRPIAEVTIGDSVLAKNPSTGEQSARQVTLLHANRDLDLTDVTVSDRPAEDTAAKTSVNEGKGDRSTRGPTTAVLKTTAHHPFWDATTSDWVDAADLTAGKSTLVGPDGQIQYVTAVHHHTGAKVMRDLTVADIHTYYVIAGDQPVLVHNCGGGTDATGRKCDCSVPDQGEGNFVYRNLRPDEDPVNGLVAKSPAATYTPAGHVLNGSRVNWRSQYISTTRSLAAANQWASGRMVRIDLDKLSGGIFDLSTDAGRAKHGIKGFTAINRAKSSGEVLLTGHVPADAISWVAGGPQ